jgi:4-amino-4-deoxy-L-arabinose transferase-like glycosyltransferase
MNPGKRGDPVRRLAAALVDPARRDRAVALLLIAYVVLWSLYGALAKMSQDIHFDMGEAVAWSREPAWGTPKHPPLSAWLVAAWFAVFPLADWAYYLFAMIVATAGLAVAWALSGRYLDGEKRAAGLALLSLVPFYNFHALKFNANAVLIPAWALTTWFFLRSFEIRRTRDAALAGFFAAAAMYGKYWSIVLIAGLGLAALLDRRRATYFGSPAPWVTAAVGGLALAPHFAWLITNDFSPFGYALASHAAASTSTVVTTALGFLGGAVGYMAVPAALALVMARPSLAAVADTLWPADSERRLVVTAFWAPLLIAAVAAIAAGAMIVSLWAMPALTLLPVVLLSSPAVVIPRAALVRLLWFAMGLPVVAAVAAPGIAYVIHRNGVPNYAAHYRLLAEAIDRAWHESVAAPLRLVGSYTNIVNGVVFYLPDRPSTYDVIGPAETPWVDEARIARDGIALACPIAEAICLSAIDRFAAGRPVARRLEVELSRRYFGVSDRPERYQIVIIRPREKDDR